MPGTGVLLQGCDFIGQIVIFFYSVIGEYYAFHLPHEAVLFLSYVSPSLPLREENPEDERDLATSFLYV